jgi:hypothetical protein
VERANESLQSLFDTADRRGATVPADVLKGADCTGVIAHHDNGEFAPITQKIRIQFFDMGCMANHFGIVREFGLQCVIEDGWRSIDLDGQWNDPAQHLLLPTAFS